MFMALLYNFNKSNCPNFISWFPEGSCFMDNTFTNGASARSSTQTSSFACQAYCQLYSDCLFFLFLKSSNLCYVISSSSGSLSSNTNYVFGPPWCAGNNEFYVGLFNKKRVLYIQLIIGHLWNQAPVYPSQSGINTDGIQLYKHEIFIRIPVVGCHWSWLDKKMLLI